MLYNSLLTVLFLFSSFENSECAGSRLLKMPNNINLDSKPIEILNTAKEATANKLGDINGITETIKNGANNDIFSGFVPAQNSMNKLIFLIKNGYMTAAQAVEYGLATKDQLIADGVAQLSDFGISGEDGEDAVIGNTGNRFLTIDEAISGGFISVTDAISDGLITATEAVEDGYITAKDAVNYGFMTVFDAIKAGVMTAQDAVDDALATKDELIDAGVAVLDDFTDFVDSAADDVVDTANDVADWFCSWWWC